MARVTGPFYSLSASGSIGKALTAATWKGIAYMREWFKPQNPNTEQQQWIRGIFVHAVDGWQGLDAAGKTLWDVAVLTIGKTMSGFNFYMSEYIDDMKVGDTPSDTPPA
jgi:hypothetical protein